MSTASPVSSRKWSFGSIPAEWCTLPLKYLCSRSSLYGANIEASVYENDGVRFLRTTDIRDDGTLNEGSVSVPADMVADYMLSEGDFLISRSGTVGRAYVYRPEDGPCAYAGYLVRYVLRDPDSPRWLFYITKSPGFQQWLGAAAIEATIGNVNGEKYANLLVPVPPLTQQRAIADYLDRETARLDALVAAKERVLGLLAEKRRALITRAVTRGLDPRARLRDSGIPWLGKIPAHWKVTRLKFVACVQTGIALGKSFGNKLRREYPYMRVANVQDGYLDLTEVKSIAVPDEEALLYYLQAGDVLMNEGGDADKLGRGAIWTGQITPCLHQNHVFAVRPRGISSGWLNGWTSSDVAKAYFESRAKQSTNLASISASNLSEMPLLKPPDQEQKGVVDHINRYTGKIDKIRKTTRRTIALLKERRSAVIAAAVTGRIDVGSAG